MFYHDSPPQSRPFEELGRSYALETDGIRIKAYPCGGLTHPAIDAALEMRAKHGISAEMIESIDVDVTKHTYSRIVFRLPRTGLQGKFSMGYLLARAIIDGRVSLENFTDQAVRDRNILALAEKVQMRLDPSLKANNAGGRPCRVTIRLQNGQTHSRLAEHAKGSPEIPMTQDELKTKFVECARQAISESAAQRALEIGAEALLMGKQGVDGVYDSDPKKNPDAVKFDQLSYDDFLARGLRVADATAISLARDNALPIVIFGLEEGNIARVVHGEKIGTVVSPGQ